MGVGHRLKFPHARADSDVIFCRTALPVTRAVLAAAAFLCLPLAGVARQPPAPPATLRDTGLYADWAGRLVGPDILAFSPQYPLWTDGATKRRWMQLPPGTQIDASNPDAWDFPVGTRFWKEFAFARRAETRFIQRTAEGWQYATYVWDEDEAEATLAPERGISRGPVIRDSVRHGIPSRSDCKSCHEASEARILGFSALQLSTDRDPNAPHGEPLPAGDVTLATLIERGLVRGLPAHLQDGAPRIAASSPTARAALGYLHGNCGYCHTLTGELASLQFSLQYPFVNAPALPLAETTTFGRPSKYVPDAWAEASSRVSAGDPDRSILVFRMSSRNPASQMPPLGTRLVDDDAVALIRTWIAEAKDAERR
jgi:mono/diheme cytochrome c family protein